MRINYGTVALRKENKNWKKSYEDLLTNGQYYFVGGTYYDENQLWFVYHNGALSFNYSSSDNRPYGIRTVIFLKAGVKVAEGSIADGLSSSSAYII